VFFAMEEPNIIPTDDFKNPMYMDNDDLIPSKGEGDGGKMMKVVSLLVQLVTMALVAVAVIIGIINIIITLTAPSCNCTTGPITSCPAVNATVAPITSCPVVNATVAGPIYANCTLSPDDLMRIADMINMSTGQSDDTDIVATLSMIKDTITSTACPEMN
jgi:hypothetical protein